MKAALITLATACALALALGRAAATPQQGSKPAPGDDTARQKQILDAAMARKLQLTHQLMTSLCVEDYARLAIDAGDLQRLGETTLMKLSPDQQYIKHANEFSRITDDLQRRARSHDLNGVTLSYIALTMNCVECHKYVRDRHSPGR